MSDMRSLLGKKMNEPLDFYEWQYYMNKVIDDPFIMSCMEDSYNDLKTCAFLSESEQDFFEAYEITVQGRTVAGNI